MEWASQKAQLDELIGQLKVAGWKEREPIKEGLQALMQASPSDKAKSYLESIKKELDLERRWDIDEVLEALAPKAEEEEEEEEEAENGQLRMSDLDEIYADPRGLALFVDRKTRTRWFAQQMDPRTGQPMMMEVPPEQIPQIKEQLKGSPYWTLGSGMLS